MKKTLLISLLVSTLVLLVACNSSTSSNSGNDTTTDPNATLTTEIKLLVGTLKLEGTDQVVTSDEAAELLPLWQAYLSLVTSQTAATEELNAVVKQIQSTMMPDQLEAIDAMDLTMEDQLTVMQSLGLGRNFGANGTPNPEGTPMAPGGMYPGGGDTGQVFIPGQGGDRPSFRPSRRRSNPGWGTRQEFPWRWYRRWKPG